MLAPCVLNRLIRDCGKSWTYFIGWCHKNCCLFQLQLFLLFIIFFSLERSNFHFAQKSFAFNTKDILLVREQKNAFNCSPPVCLTVGTLFLRHENIFQLTAYGFIHWTFIACVITYFPGQFITSICVFLAMTTLCRDIFFFSLDCLRRTSLSKPGKSSPRHRTIWRFFPPRKATFLFTQKLVILT